jgi:hypothetical protein
MKIFGTIFFQKKQVALGKGSVMQYILMENKWLFSIIFYKWATIDQIRFHTHAFHSVAFLLKGWYWEKVKFQTGDVKFQASNLVNIPLYPRIIQKNYCHAIQKARPGTMTMVIAGPWEKHWAEFFPADKKWVKYAWGRKKIGFFDTLEEVGL